MTRILISADIEGVAGIYHVEQTRPGNAEYERGRRLMTEEVNAVVTGALAGGASEVYVNDSHGSFRNLLVDLLHPKALVIQGKPRLEGMMSGIQENVDAVMMVGYHARAGSRGILAHTVNSFAFAAVKINGKEYGEAGLYGALAGEAGVPVALVSGDNISNNEAAAHFPKAVFVTVKNASGYNSGISQSREAVTIALSEGATTAVARISELDPFRIGPALDCELRTNGPAFADLFSQLPIITRVDGIHVRFSAPDIGYAIRVLNSLSAMSSLLR